MALRFDQIELSGSTNGEKPVIKASTDYVQVNTAHGYTNIGPGNSSYSHFATDRSKFYFNRAIVVDTGIFATYDEPMQLQANDGIPRIYINNSSGNVGIGTTNPNQALHVNTTGSGGVRIQANTTPAPAEYQSFAEFYINSTQTAKIYSSSYTSKGLRISERGTDVLDIDGTNGLKVLTGKLVVGTSSATVSIDAGSNTDAIKIPAGTTAQRPTGANGMLRYNSDDAQFEGYADGAWGAIAGSGGGASGLVQNSFTGNGSTVNFTLSTTPADENFTFVFIQGVYQDKSTYTVSGNTITFSTAPQNGYSIEVMSIGAVSIQQASYLEYDNFTGNGSTTNYTLLNGSPSDEKFTMVYIQGVYQEKSTYSLSSGNIIFSTAPESGDTIEIMSVNGGGIQAAQSYTPTEVVKTNVEVISTNTTALGHGYLYVFTASLTLTLPTSPAVGDSIKISNRSGTTTCVLGRNGNNIMGSASDLTIDALNAGFELIYSGASEGWIIIGN